MESISTGSSCCCDTKFLSLEIQSQLTNIVIELVDGVGAHGGRARGGVGGGVARVLDVGVVLGDGGGAGAAGHQAAHSKASST